MFEAKYIAKVNAFCNANILQILQIYDIIKMYKCLYNFQHGILSKWKTNIMFYFIEGITMKKDYTVNGIYLDSEWTNVAVNTDSSDREK